MISKVIGMFIHDRYVCRFRAIEDTIPNNEKCSSKEVPTRVLGIDVN